MGRGPGNRSQPLSSCLSTRRTVKIWPHFDQFLPIQALLSTHPSKQPLIKQKEQKVGGRVTRSDRAQEPGQGGSGGSASPSLM